jgi:hypothetical protein
MAHLVDVMLQSLANIPGNHPSLFGESELIPAQPLIIEEDPTVLPRHLTASASDDWAIRFSQGIFNAAGDHIEALSDIRANRRLFFPSPRLENALGYDPAKVTHKKFMLYGGTLYDHFGDMLVDTCRAYQLLRLFRHSKEPIWFHYAAPRSARHLRAPTIEAWLKCLGLGERFRLIRKTMRPKRLVSCPQIYRDLKFISEDYAPAARAALHPKLRRHLEKIQPIGQRIAYLSRSKLNQGTSKFIQESELVEQLRTIPEIDIIYPEELSFEDKLALWRSHAYIVGFPQGCLMLKPFVPYTTVEEIASMIFLLAGPGCLPSTWLNVEKACQFGDHYLDCHGEPKQQPSQQLIGQPNQQPEATLPSASFTRANSIDVARIVEAMRGLAASLR